VSDGTLKPPVQSINKTLGCDKPLQLSCYGATGSGVQPFVRRIEDNLLRHTYILALLLLLSPVVNFAQETPGVQSPAFATVPELSAGFDLLYRQRFAEAREAFASWESRNPQEPFGQVAIAAGYLFEELSRQGVLTSDFFLNEKKFLHGI